MAGDWLAPGVILTAVGLSWAVAVAYTKSTNRIAVIEDRVGILWRWMESQASNAVHHTTTPELDALLEAYAARTLSPQGVGQLAARLRLLSEDPEQKPIAQENARALLAVVVRESNIRRVAGEPGSVVTFASQEEDQRAAAAMAAESRPNAPPDPLPAQGERE